jgi:glutathione S-transferase/RNA polymerase-associated protein
LTAPEKPWLHGSMPLLYDVPMSPYAQKVKMALIEKGVEFETRIPDLDKPEPEFVRASPRLEVPALVDGEAVLFDSSVIVEYIEDRWPDTALLPASPLERARVRMLEEVCDTAYDAVVWGIAEVGIFKRAEGEEATQLLARARKQIAGLNAYLDRQLEGRAFLNGDKFGFGDIAAYPFVNGAGALGYKCTPGSRLEAWLKATRKRASAERCRTDIVTTLEQFLRRPADIAEGRSKREYRDHRLDWMMRSGGVEVVLEGIRKQNIRFTRDI